jgi:hypothetical protein
LQNAVGAEREVGQTPLEEVGKTVDFPSGTGSGGGRGGEYAQSESKTVFQAKSMVRGDIFRLVLLFDILPIPRYM